MSSGPVLFCDSGVGGLPYLEWVRARLPRQRFVYVADNANFPYGEKRPEELREIVVSLVGDLIVEFEPALVVIACNTASVVALAALRERYSVPFVGVVPAVKPAAERSRVRKIALLATTRTVSDAYSEELIRRFASDCNVVRIAGQALVSFIENDYLDASPERVREAMEAAVAPLRSEHVDSLILGCTHFTFLDRELKEELGSAVEIIDSREGVGRQVIRLVGANGRQTAPADPDDVDADHGDLHGAHPDGSHPGGGQPEGGQPAGEATLFHTAAEEGRYKRYADHFGLDYGGVIR